MVDKNGGVPPANTLRYRANSKTNSKGLSKDMQPKLMADSWHSLTALAYSMEKPESSLLTPHRPHLSLHTHTQSFTSVIKEIIQGVKETMDVTMLKNPVFVIYGFSCILCMAGFFVPFIYLPDKAIGAGYGASKGALLLSILGITNTVGRILAGWVSDRPWADCLIINNVALIIGGVATILCPFCNSYGLLVLYACIFGMSLAAFVTLRSIILVDLIGLDQLTSAFGLIVLCQGLTSFVGAPLAGALYDMTGTYDLSFYVAGSTITLAGIICIPLRRLSKINIPTVVDSNTICLLEETANKLDIKIIKEIVSNV